MRPCDCKDQVDADSMDAQGIGINDWSINVEPRMVSIRNSHFGEVKLPMSVMKVFAEWYMEDQDSECDCANGCSSANCDKR